MRRKNALSLQRGQVCFFLNQDAKLLRSQWVGSLSKCLRIIKKFEGRRRFIFTYSSSQGDFHQNLTVRENILMLSGQSSVRSRTKTIYKKIMQFPLSKDWFKISMLDQPVKNLSLENRKCLSIMVALMLPSSYIVLEQPSRLLSSRRTTLLKKTIRSEMILKRKKIILSGLNHKSWSSFVKYFVVQDRHGRFQFLTKRKHIYRKLERDKKILYPLAS